MIIERKSGVKLRQWSNQYYIYTLVCFIQMITIFKTNIKYILNIKIFMCILAFKINILFKNYIFILFQKIKNQILDLI